MKEENISNDVAKECLTVLSYCDNSFINKIPEYILKKLNNIAADSSKEFYINKNKALIEQDISDECKDLISLIYFMYMTNSSSKKEILNTILNNIDNSIII